MPTRKLAPIRRVLCAAPSLLALLPRIESPHQFSELPTVHFSPLQTGAAWSLQNGEERVLVPIEPRLRADNAIANYEAVKASVGIGMLATFVCHQDLREGRLVEVLPTWQAPPAWALALYPSHRQVAKKVRAMIDFVVENFQPVPSWER